MSGDIEVIDGGHVLRTYHLKAYHSYFVLTSNYSEFSTSIHHLNVAHLKLFVYLTNSEKLFCDGFSVSRH